MSKPLKIAMIGQKGIPARYGGVETHVEQIATRLAAKGHEVWAFCRQRFRPDPSEITGRNGFRSDGGDLTYQGVHLAYRPSVNTKHFDAATHSMFCALESGMRGSFDIVHFHGIGPSAFAPIPRAFGRTVVSTIHALDWRQVKWGGLAKKSLLRGEETGIRRSTGVIAVSELLVEYIRDRYGVEAQYIPNGATVGDREAPDIIKQFGLQGDDYVLTVGRIIPDRCLDLLIEAFNRIDTPLKLVVVGSEVPRTEYSDRLRAMAGERVIFTGDLYGQALAELYSNCRFYVLASRVEGLPISVCEAMGYGRCVLLSDIPENQEVGGNIARYFKTDDGNDLQAQLQALLESPDEVARRGQQSTERVGDKYDWDVLAEQVEAFYHKTLS